MLRTAGVKKKTKWEKDPIIPFFRLSGRVL
jgi:hypothetical protein